MEENITTNLDDSTNIELITAPEKIKEISEKIFPIIKTKDEVKILTEFYKDDYKNIDLTLCIDDTFNNNTILISLVYYNLTNVIITIISTLSHTYKSKDNFIPYLNQKNIKGYNALLYAAFRGNLEIFEKLIKLGADLDIINSSGLNVLHLAVQGNHPNLIVYLIEKCGFNINSKDNNGRTALHWGISMNSKQAVDYLVYYNIDINIKDNNGVTALDIAYDKGNVYFIKKFNEDFSVFINKDINEEIKDENDIENNNMDNNNEENIQSRKNKFYNKFWGIKSKNMAAFPFILIIFALEGTNQMIILKGYSNLYMSFIFFILFFLLLFFYYITSKSNPGEVQIDYENSLLLLIEKGEDLKNICPWCISTINENTYHCFLCNKCFEYQEFHDVILNNCIGEKNFLLYLNFLNYLIIVSSFKLFISFLAIFWVKGDNYLNVIKLVFVQIIITLGLICFGICKINQIKNNQKKPTNKNINIQMTEMKNEE